MNAMLHYIAPPADRQKSGVTVGIPRAMGYYEHGRLWENFFTLLGCSVIVSPATNRQILDLGVNNCSNETCLPVKVMAGHVCLLADKADVIFIPRIVSYSDHEITCPKVCSLPDMIRMSLRGRVDVMEVAVDFGRGEEITDRSLTQVAGRLQLDADTVRRAFFKAVRNRMRAGMEAAAQPDGRPAITLLGHPYMINDRYISMNITDKLQKHGYRVVMPADIPYDRRRENAYPYRGRQFYDIGLDNLGSAFSCAEKGTVKGLIYLTPFACGIDSLVTEMIERHLHRIGCEIPYMKLTVDEHTGEAGFDTRIEAFLDMLGAERKPS